MYINFKDLENADLIVDRVYKGGENKDISSDTINKLMLCENSGGFRVKVKEDGGKKKYKINYIALYSSGEDLNWQDKLDLNLGRLTYYGDNKKPGKLLHETSKKGNLILKETFNRLHEGKRDSIPPFFVFTKDKGRDVRFRGLAAPGDSRLAREDELIAKWSIKDGQRYQNYEAIFTILDIDYIPKQWILELREGRGIESKYTPDVWKKWIKEGIYKPLLAKQDIMYRTKEQQIPKDKKYIKIINLIREYFETPYAFEACAAKIFQMTSSNVVSYDMTRNAADGGRDAIGIYRIGNHKTNINVEFSLEAKFYDMENAVGVKEMSRLISRIRFRQFGVLVTTSYVANQAYKEIVEDKHPIIIISANDIVDILINAGYKDEYQVSEWLNENFETR